MSQRTLKSTLENAIASLRDDPGGSQLTITARTRLLDGVRCSANVRHFSPLTIDEPPELGGGDAGPNPAELLLAALGTCQEIVYAAYAAILDIPLAAVEVTARGHLDLRGLLGLDESTPAGFQKITFETALESPADPETIRGLVETVERHCPILDTLSRPVPVEGTVALNGAPLNNPVSHAA